MDEWHEQRARLRAAASEPPTSDDDHSPTTHSGADDPAAHDGLADAADPAGAAGVEGMAVHDQADDAVVHHEAGDVVVRDDTDDVVVPAHVEDVVVPAQMDDEGVPGWGTGGQAVVVPPAWGPGRKMAAPTFHWPGDPRPQADERETDATREADRSLSNRAVAGLGGGASVAPGDEADVGPRRRAVVAPEGDAGVGPRKTGVASEGDAGVGLSEGAGVTPGSEADVALGGEAGFGLRPRSEVFMTWPGAEHGDPADQHTPGRLDSADPSVQDDEATPDGSPADRGRAGGRTGGRARGRASRGRSDDGADAPIFVWPGERKTPAGRDTAASLLAEDARTEPARKGSSGRRKKKAQVAEDFAGGALDELGDHDGEGAARVAGRRTSRRRAQDGEGFAGSPSDELSGHDGEDAAGVAPRRTSGRGVQEREESSGARSAGLSGQDDGGAAEENLREREDPYEPGGVGGRPEGEASAEEKRGADEWHSEVLAGSSWFGDEQDAGGKKRSGKGRRIGGRSTGRGNGKGSGRFGRGASGRGGPLSDGSPSDGPMHDGPLHEGSSYGGPSHGGPLPDGPDVGSSAAAAPAADPESVARAICLRLLTMAPKTRAQLAEALRKRDVPDEAAEKVLDRFVELGLINDEAFAEAWVDSRHHGRGLAKRALAAELRHRGVDTETVKEAVERLDSDQEAETARRLVDRKLASTRSLDAQTRTRRLAGMLARKGYSSGLAYRVIREALEQEGIDLEDDFS
ncbi:recombination regulator RecX [Nonomuraea sp. NPDC001636]|uniref:recombination regulator RecX n=1 Tax=Nonomuraea sp. NPDC001636 TaxID=3154391 RepID=UPI003319AE81